VGKPKAVYQSSLHSFYLLTLMMPCVAGLRLAQAKR
jgi:hypothetical protein